MTFINKDKVKLLLQLYKKHKSKIYTKSDFFKLIFRKLKKKKVSFISEISRKNFLKFFRLKTKAKSKKIKQNFSIDNKFLSKRFSKMLLNFKLLKRYDNIKSIVNKRLKKINRLYKRRKNKPNLSRKTYFFRIMKKKKRRRRVKMFRSNDKKPLFTRKLKRENKFLLKSRESLLKTKKYLYRKKFPKIKGKKNKNFNFFFYNNMDRVPFKFEIGRVVITYLINNTFINIHNSKKMLKVISAGKLGFKGPKRSTTYSRQIVARKAVNFITKTKMNVLDIFLNSNYNRWYYFLFKEISRPKIKSYVVRYLIISNPRPHGFIRDRKHRRK